MTSAPIMVTGSNGRFGRALQRRMTDAQSVVGVVSPRAADGDPHVLDVTDADATSALIAEVRPRVIIHLASVIGAACEADPANAEAVNVLGTANILSGALAHGVERIVFASTAGVYGDSRRRPVSEADSVAPGGVYASTKLRAERVLADAVGPISMDILRVFNVYGPEMTDSLVTRLFDPRGGAPIRLNGLDGFVRDYVHVDDVARAFLAASDSTEAGYRVLNVGSGVPRSNRALLDVLPAEVRARVDVGPEVASYSCANIEAIARELSWRPEAPWPPEVQVA